MTSTIRPTVKTPRDSTAPKFIIPFAEKTARMDQIRQRLHGFNITRAGEPSHSLLDECAHQLETRVLKYLEVSRCTSRENETTAGRTDKCLKLDSGTLSIKETKTVPDEVVPTTYNLAACLRGRGIAYDFANLITFTDHELYVEKLLRHLTIETSPAYQAVTFSPVLRADKEVFLYLAHNIPDIRPGPDGPRPLDGGLDAALRDYNAAFHVLLLPTAAVAEVAPLKYAAEPHPSPSNQKGRGKGKLKGGKSALASTSVHVQRHLQAEHAPKAGMSVSKQGAFKAYAFRDGHPDEVQQPKE